MSEYTASDNQEWHDDDRLLHELVWSAEAFLTSLKAHGAQIPMHACPHLSNLESWVRGVRQTWTHRNEVERQGKFKCKTCEDSGWLWGGGPNRHVPCDVCEAGPVWLNAQMQQSDRQAETACEFGDALKEFEGGTGPLSPQADRGAKP